MKKYILINLILILTIIIACQSSEEKLKIKILPILTKSILNDSNIVKINKLNIYKIDTLTDLKYNTIKIQFLELRISYFQGIQIVYLKSATEYMSQSVNDFKMADTYKEINGYSPLIDIYETSAIEFMELGKAENLKAKLYSDSSKIYEAQINSINKLIKNRKLDSVEIIGYIPYYNLIGSNKKGVELKIDSNRDFISKELNIIRF
jgi:hypothetical protein